MKAGDRADNAGQPARQSGRFGREVIGPPECPIMVRWTLLEGRFGKLLVHHFMPDATDAVPHDHPASFVTAVLRGSYDDVQPDGKRERMRPGKIRFRRAEHAHVTEIGPRGCWTVVLMFRKRRPWGFIHNGKWWPWREHEERFGMAMRCDGDEHDLKIPARIWVSEYDPPPGYLIWIDEYDTARILIDGEYQVIHRDTSWARALGFLDENEVSDRG